MPRNILLWIIDLMHCVLSIKLTFQNLCLLYTSGHVYAVDEIDKIIVTTIIMKSTDP